MKKTQPIAIIDLGSNSFRLMIGYFEQSNFVQTDYLKETVRQGALNDQGNITPDAFDRGLACLARFKERLANIKPHNIRAIATHTLREATNRYEFMAQAQHVLGVAIEVVSGDEEARLVFSGVTHLLPQSNQYRTAIDIGGRSTELVSGKHTEAEHMFSIAVGSVSATQKYFADGRINPENLAMALTGISTHFADLKNIFAPYVFAGEVWGCSGTIGAIYNVLLAHGRSDHTSLKISKDDMDWLKNQLLTAQAIENIELNGLKTERKPIFIGGFMILYSLFKVFDLSAVYAAAGALRHGIAYDCNERIDRSVCRRQNTINNLMRKFSVDITFSTLILQTIQQLFTTLDLTFIDPDNQNSDDLATQIELCGLAGQLCQLGACISYDKSHKHGAYIVQHSQLTGFYESEKIRLAQLLEMSSGKLKPFNEQLNNPTLAMQVFVLRTALALCHAHLAPKLEGVSCQLTAKGFGIYVNPQWAQDYPQTMFILQEEVQYWAKAGQNIHLETT